MNVILTVAKKYTINGDAGNFTYTVPAYNQDYEINLSFPNNVQTAFAGNTFPNYKQAFSSSCIERRAYNWTGLTQTEVNLFTSFIKAFNNSWQPFTLTYNSVAEDLIVESDPTVGKDNLGLYSLTLNLIKI